MRLRHLVLTIVLLVGMTVPTSAFKFWFHEEITYAAIKDALGMLPPDMRQKILTVPGVTIEKFTDRAAEEIARANKARDSGDCGRPDDYTVAASPCGQFDGVLSE